MSLFQNTVLKKYRQSQPQATLDSQWEVYRNIFHDTAKQANIRAGKEEQYQAIFLKDLFVHVLGYILHPDANYTIITELKNITNSKKADGAIIIDEMVKAVIELKGTDTTDLGKIEAQAFGYKTNQRDCRYVVISNFEKLRFYIDDATEFVEFNLFTLSKDEFTTLWLCLAFDNIKNDLPAKIKAESVSNEDKITKELYKDYSAFRKELFHNIVALNPQYNKLELFKKTQKLLDRFLFIFFAEDRLLLPTNLIFSINLEWENIRKMRLPISLYDRYKEYFNDLNTGARVSLPTFGKHTNETVTAEYDIYAYNGGLFQTDELLDSIKIDDDLLFKHTKKMSEYDFESEVDVNILGHIFENSLNEIDEIANEIEGTVTEKTKTKRKKDGVFYTPKYITKYIVDNTIWKLCTEKKAELQLDETQYTTDKRIQQKTKKDLLAKLETYRKWLLELTIVDPACGSGAFLNQALEFLIAEHRYIDELQAKLFGDALVLSDVEGSILENNLYGVDLNEESVEIAKLSLWLRTAQRNRKLNSLNNNIKCGNSLIDDPEVAGDKAFNWQEAFPKVFSKGGFDVVIGNPPYVRVQNLNHIEIDYFKSNKLTAFKRVDISTLFFELSYFILKPKGILSFITSNQFQSAEYGQEIRTFIKNRYRIKSIIDFGDLPVFEGALTYVSIYCFEKNAPVNFYYKRVKSLLENIFDENYIEFDLNKLDDDKWIFTNNTDSELLKKLHSDCNLGKYGNAWAGLFTGKDDVLMFSNDELNDSDIEKELFLPVLRAEDMSRNGYVEPSKFVLYPYKEDNGKTIVLTEEELKSSYPNGYNYLLKHKIELQSRKDSRKTFKERKDWYALTRFGTKKIFVQQKIVSPGEVKGHKFSIDTTGSGFSCARVFAITINDRFDLKVIMVILNSKLAQFYLQRNSSLKAGGYYSYSSNVLNSFPLKESIPHTFIEISNKVIQIQNEFKNLIQKFQRTLQRKFELDDLPKKLQDWYLLSYAEFIKELAKKKIKLSLAQEAEWEDYFMTERKKALDLKAQIDATDKAIDKMVYALYGLTEEEIGIVENS